MVGSEPQRRLERSVLRMTLVIAGGTLVLAGLGGMIVAMGIWELEALGQMLYGSLVGGFIGGSISMLLLVATDERLQDL